MRHLLNFATFNESVNQEEMLTAFRDADILESIVTDTNELLTSIKAEEVDMFTDIGLPADTLPAGSSIEDLFDNAEFNKRLSMKKLWKNFVEYSNESETFLDETIHVKFFTVHEAGKSQLERPVYIVYQSRKDDSGWEDIKCYRVNDDMRKFYDKLSSKTIELKANGKSYVYTTSNCADWTLMKNDDDQDTRKFKDNLSNTDIKAMLRDKNVTITILR